jgi:hypothetical protein
MYVVALALGGARSVAVAGGGVEMIGRGVGVEMVGRGVGVTGASGDGSVVAAGVAADVLAIGASGGVVARTAVASGAALGRSGPACSTRPGPVAVHAPARTAAMRNDIGLTLRLTAFHAARCEGISPGAGAKFGLDRVPVLAV